MKNAIKLHEFQAQKKAEEPWVKPRPCMICGKTIPGAYGMWEDGWSCSKKCEQEVVKLKENRYASVPNQQDEGASAHGP